MFMIYLSYMFMNNLSSHFFPSEEFGRLRALCRTAELLKLCSCSSGVQWLSILSLSKTYRLKILDPQQQMYPERNLLECFSR